MPALCSATYFFISSYVALVSADVISTSSSSIVTFVWPSSNQDYWRPKILRNVERDHLSRQELEALGWKVIVVWECELKKKVRDTRLAELEAEIRNQNKEV